MDAVRIERLRAIKQAHTPYLINLPGVHTVDVGFVYHDGERTDEIAIRVHVEELTDELRAAIPQTLDGEPVHLLVHGRPRLLGRLPDGPTNPPPLDPLPHPLLVGGLSSGPCRLITYDRNEPGVGLRDYSGGTLGVVVARGTEFYALSNFHVYAGDACWLIGDCISQPAPDRNGTIDTIGTLQDAYFPGIFASTVGDVDAAIARITDRGVSNEIQNIGYVNGSTTATLGDIVRKSGATSGVTEGTIEGMFATVNPEVNMGYVLGTAVVFENQLEIVGTESIYLQGGDSGSVSVNADNQVVGLNFCIDPSGRAFANPIHTVESAFFCKVMPALEFVSDIVDTSTAQTTCTASTTINGVGYVAMGWSGFGQVTVYRFDGKTAPTPVARANNDPFRTVTCMTFGQVAGTSYLAVGLSEGSGLRFCVYPFVDERLGTAVAGGNGWGGSRSCTSIVFGLVGSSTYLFVGRDGNDHDRYMAYSFNGQTLGSEIGGGSGWGRGRYPTSLAVGQVNNQTFLFIGRTAGNHSRLAAVSFDGTSFGQEIWATTDWSDTRGVTSIAQSTFSGTTYIAVGRSAGDHARVLLYTFDGAQFGTPIENSMGWDDLREATAVSLVQYRSQLFLAVGGDAGDGSRVALFRLSGANLISVFTVAGALVIPAVNGMSVSMVGDWAYLFVGLNLADKLSRSLLVYRLLAR